LITFCDHPGQRGWSGSTPAPEPAGRPSAASAAGRRAALRPGRGGLRPGRRAERERPDRPWLAGLLPAADRRAIDLGRGPGGVRCCSPEISTGQRAL